VVASGGYRGVLVWSDGAAVRRVPYYIGKSPLGGYGRPAPPRTRRGGLLGKERSESAEVARHCFGGGGGDLGQQGRGPGSVFCLPISQLARRPFGIMKRPLASSYRSRERRGSGSAMELPHRGLMMTMKERQRKRVVESIDVKANPYCEQRRLEEEQRLQALNRNPQLNHLTRADMKRSESFLMSGSASRRRAIEAQRRILAASDVGRPNRSNITGASSSSSVPTLKDITQPTVKSIPAASSMEDILQPYAKEAMAAPSSSFGHRPSSAQRMFNPTTMSTNVDRLRRPSLIGPGRKRIGMSSTMLQQLLALDSPAPAASRPSLAMPSKADSAVVYSQDVDSALQMILSDGPEPWNPSFGSIRAASELTRKGPAGATMLGHTLPDRGESYAARRILYNREAAGVLDEPYSTLGSNILAPKCAAQEPQALLSPRGALAHLETLRMKKERSERECLNERRVRKAELITHYRKIPPSDRQYEDLLKQAQLRGFTVRRTISS
jgi:hypothetical protein